MVLLKKWIFIRKQNFLFLKNIAEQIGKEFECLPYAILADPNQPLSYERMIGGVKISWSTDVINSKKNGDIYFAMEFYSDLPTFFGAKPAHSFWKTPDESVYY
jgi:hypothetical protein